MPRNFMYSESQPKACKMCFKKAGKDGLVKITSNKQIQICKQCNLNNEDGLRIGSNQMQRKNNFEKDNFVVTQGTQGEKNAWFKPAAFYIW